MALKRDYTDTEPADEHRKPKRMRKGFSVGPENLPDGTHKRKVQKIKKDLIRKAQIKKSYNKLKEREQQENPEIGSHGHRATEAAATSLELHPERQAMLDEPDIPQNEPNEPNLRRQRRPTRPKPVPFEKETRLAQQRSEERERRQKEIEESSRQRHAKLKERERWRKAMEKARVGGRDGKRKLGRESKVLLERVQRMVNG
ncbi:hypothetical protein MMC21_006080 [Puttea exsequens]|nr:hypothetical protein [Puttea exsequens]